MTSVRDTEEVVREYWASQPRRNRLLPVLHRHPRGSFMPVPVGVCCALLLCLLVAVAVALRF